MKRNSIAIEQNALKIRICKICYLSMQPAKSHAFANKRLRWWSRWTNWEVRLVASINKRDNAPHIVIISDQRILKKLNWTDKKNYVYKLHTLYSVLKMFVKNILVQEKTRLTRIFIEFGQIYFGESQKTKTRDIHEKVSEKILISIA